MLELFDGAFWRDPYPAYAQLRDAAPVCRVERADGVVRLLSRYADVRAALADPRLSKDWRYMLPPEQRELLGRRPERMPAAVEELLRWDSPVHNAPVRFAAEDVEVAGTTIPVGAVVQLSLGAAPGRMTPCSAA